MNKQESIKKALRPLVDEMVSEKLEEILSNPDILGAILDNYSKNIETLVEAKVKEMALNSDLISKIITESVIAARELTITEVRHTTKLQPLQPKKQNDFDKKKYVNYLMGAAAPEQTSQEPPEELIQKLTEKTNTDMSKIFAGVAPMRQDGGGAGYTASPSGGVPGHVLAELMKIKK